MSRAALPDHENLSTISPLRVRGTPAFRHVCQEIGSEYNLTETAFARTSLLILLKAISQHEPGILARAVKRANRSLIEQGFPPVTEEEILNGSGLPERGLLQFSQEDEAIYDEERPKRPLQRLVNFVLGR
ncbi:TPA: hypothetical protein P2N04_001066 [Aeromonas salmonicida]|mgnify:FL=1|uniref:Uncharacterized protein n=2 Tax=Aeromonas TaxID=642 RepID=A0A0F6T1N8_AERSS|nr:MULTISPECIES: hypothetical protein [Aeromonas]AKD43419.1 hypothetical protein [Aeromonas salmonicida subsp. salmonicida]KIX25536.1 hypothetical protein TM02_08440 [Aeromonas salmonicida subsp. salmonicida]MBM9522640.1 hypothetical protein [Aeromonas salmonicida subsp. salmonicida]MBS2781712.1 hypothetical protein [Aeromonas salmonicida]MDF8330550.1 hypothetical protein [Aeromonas salmonicida]